MSPDVTNPVPLDTLKYVCFTYFYYVSTVKIPLLCNSVTQEHDLSRPYCVRPLLVKDALSAFAWLCFWPRLLCTLGKGRLLGFSELETSFRDIQDFALREYGTAQLNAQSSRHSVVHQPAVYKVLSATFVVPAPAA